MSWTHEMVDRLTEMWLSGSTTNEIAKELGVSKNSIVGKVHRLNLTSRPSPIKKKEYEEEIKKVVQQKTLKSKDDTEKKAVKRPVIIPQQVTEEQLHTQKNTAVKECIKLSELNGRTCRWPIGDPKDENFCFCGKRVRTGQTYCDEHAAIAYVKPIRK